MTRTERIGVVNFLKDTVGAMERRPDAGTLRDSIDRLKGEIDRLEAAIDLEDEHD